MVAVVGFLFVVKHGVRSFLDGFSMHAVVHVVCVDQYSTHYGCSGWISIPMKHDVCPFLDGFSNTLDGHFNHTPSLGQRIRFLHIFRDSNNVIDVRNGILHAQWISDGVLDRHPDSYR
jgi:hypothetical protein